MLFPYVTLNGTSFPTSNPGGPAPGCTFNNTTVTVNNPPPTDIAWFPASDVFGNQLSPSTGAYKTGVTMTGTHVVSNSWSAYKAGVFNAVDNMGYRARTNMGQSSSAGIGAVTILRHRAWAATPGSALDPILLQRLAKRSERRQLQHSDAVLAVLSRIDLRSISQQPARHVRLFGEPQRPEPGVSDHFPRRS